MSKDTKVTKAEAASLGGIGRAASLSKTDRARIARQAARARWAAEKGVMQGTHDGAIRIGNTLIACAVLGDGTRVLNSSALRAAFSYAKRGTNFEKGPELSNYPPFLAVASVRPHVSAELHEKLSAPLRYTPAKGGTLTAAFQADVLPLICEALIDARNAGHLQPQQMRHADAAEMLHRQLAKVGIVALIDEATGYEKVRDRDALQAILDQYLRAELSVWAKKFPDEFYKQIFRLRNWEWKGMKVNRPQCVGKYTRDIVYERLAPGVLDELDRRNAELESKGKRAKRHQWLTDDIGVPALSQHIHATIGFMRASDNWSQFKNMMDRAFPKKDETLLLPLMIAARAEDEDE